jgi:hypothetical protein
LLLWSFEDQGFSMSDFSNKSVLLVATTPNPSPQIPEFGGFVPLLMYGGVAVAVILAMAYFSQTQLKAIAHLINTTNKKKK